MRGRRDVFDDVKKLHEMLALREGGAGLSELGRMYGVDHSTIFYHSKKNGIVPPAVTTVSARPAPVKRIHVTISLSGIQVRLADDGSPVNAGKDYAEYLKEQEDRRWAELLAGGKHRNK